MISPTPPPAAQATPALKIPKNYADLKWDMSAFRALLFLTIISGLMWARELTQSPTSNQAYDPETLLRSAKLDSADSKESLSYAFRETMNSPPSPQDQNLSARIEESKPNFDREKITSLRLRPYSLIATAQQYLSDPTTDKLPQRSSWLQAVVEVKTPETQKQATDIFNQEVEWIQRESSNIPDTSEFANYIDEFVRLSLSSLSKPKDLDAALENISGAISRHPNAMRSLEQSIQSYIPWKHENWSKEHRGTKH